MITKLMLLVAMTLAVWGQSYNKLLITPNQANLTPGILGFRPLYPSLYEVQLSSPDALAATVRFRLPGDYGSSGNCIKTDGSGQWSWDSCGSEVLVSDYNWTQVVGARSGSGTLTLTFTGNHCPAAGTDVNYVFRLYETVTPTTDEIAISDGTGTCTRGGSGTIVATGPTGTYTNATATSANGGWQEAIFSVPDSASVRVRAGIGNYEIYSDILGENRYVNIECDGPGATLIPKVDNLSVFNFSGPGGPRIRGCAITNTFGHTGVSGIKTLNAVGDSFGTSIVDVQISGVETCFNLQTVYGITAFAYNRAINCTDTALYLSNVNTGDAGIGLIGPGNIFSDSVTANYGIHWNGPGNLKVQGNSFNGYIEQFHLEPKMGVVDVVGTAVTWVSGNRFRPSMAGGGFVASNTVAASVASYNSSTSLTLVANSVTCTGCSYYVGNTGQMQIMNNTLDAWTWTEKTIRTVGGIPFYNLQINNNFFSNPNTGTHYGISLESVGFYLIDIKGNSIQSSYTPNATALSVTGGNNVRIQGNTITNHLTGVTIGSGAVNVTLDGNQCVNINTTNCLLTAAASSGINPIARETDPMTFAQLSTQNLRDSSALYCSDCKITSSSSNTCATGGSGAVATRINGAWKCQDGTAISAFVQNGNSFAADAVLGTNDNYQLIFKTNNTYQWYITTAGHWYAATNNARDIGGGLAANSPRNIYAATSVVTPKIGRDSSASFTVMTDSTDRWIVNSAGMWYPALDTTYDFGLTGTRIRSIFAQAGEFFKSGSTAASDYLDTRKYRIRDSLGASGAWDMQADVTATLSQLFVRDNAGDPFRYSLRQESGSPVNYELLYADLRPAKRETALGHSVNDTNFPKLGSSTRPWYEIWGTTGDFAADLTIHGTTVAATVNYTGGYMTGTMRPLFNATGQIGDSSYRYGNGYFSAIDVTATGFTLSASTTVGYVWTATSTGGAGQWQALSASTILPAIDTQTIIKGSADATKLLRFEVDGFTTATTRVLTPPNTNATIAGLEVTQTFVNPQTISIASVQNQLTLAQPNPTGTWDPACLVLASSDTVTSTTYGTARLCSGFESASFSDELFAIQTTTGSGIFQNALTIKNQAVSILGSISATGSATFSFVNGTMDGIMKPLFSGNGSIGDVSYRYGNGYFSAANITASGFTLADTTTVGYVWTATSTGGAGSWQPSGSSQWTTSGSDIYYTTGVVRIGDAASHVGATLELTNSTSVNLFQAKYTGSSGPGSGGGINAHLGAAPSAANHRLGFLVFGVEASGTQYNRAAVLGFSAQTWTLGSAEGAYLQFATTSTGTTTRTPRWRIAHDGHFLCETDGTCDIGASGATRPRSLYLTADIFAAGNLSVQTATLSGSLVMGSTTVINSSRNMAGLNAFAQSITFSAGSTYNVGSTGAPPLNVYGNYIEPLTELVMASGVRFTGDLIPSTNNLYAVGDTSRRVSTVVTTNINVSGTVSTPSGSTGYTGTITIRNSAGSGTCTQTFSGGWLVSTTC